MAQMDSTTDICIPHTGRRTRLAALATGAVVLIWLSLEDNTLTPVVLLGVTLAALITSLTTFDKLGGRRIPMRQLPVAAALAGAVIGLSASVMTAALMFFKNAMHAHLFPDYPPGLILAMLQRGPVWLVAGALAGLGMGLLWWSWRYND